MKTTGQFLLILMLALGPISANAHSVGENASSPSQPEQRQPLSVQSELETFGRAIVSAREGIAAVEQQLAGAKVVDISFDGQVETPVYHVKAYRNGEIWNGSIDAATRAIVRDSWMPASQLDAEDKSNIADLKRAGFDLAEAVAVAEKYGAGKAVGAGLSRADGRLIFLVVVVSDGALKEISVDPAEKSRRSPPSSRAF
ncbi:hypothetical protein I8G32_04236 [Rhodopseudomonas palustris]|nr:PepSY domain-containing protein [Rhodopseudomonas palustris]OPF92490.1 hypothetical protein B1S06_15105 [Rhodopseudomonas palustris]QQM05666.1 hypothetical protein I8G32_04236 [Rhodopseudomonas palustris]RJF63894.1 hypothetical protein D4Q71_12355 [Rhodopseudomonas palustris]WAB76995.1 PepSY domain-containing protein [Rhodopseudomonas palustris]WCL94290.1 PepSY domain-containing protein [Rhodopseudomonas palustris CGA009]